MSCRDGPHTRPAYPVNPNSKPSLVRSGMPPTFRPEGPPARQTSAPPPQLRDPSPAPQHTSATAQSVPPPTAAGSRESQGRANSHSAQLSPASITKETLGKPHGAASVPPRTATASSVSANHKSAGSDAKGGPARQASVIADYLANEEEQGKPHSLGCAFQITTTCT